MFRAVLVSIVKHETRLGAKPVLYLRGLRPYTESIRGGHPTRGFSFESADRPTSRRGGFLRVAALAGCIYIWLSQDDSSRQTLADYLSYSLDILKDSLASCLVDIVSKTLADPRVVNQARHLTAEVMDGILADESTQRLASDFVIKVLSTEQVHTFLNELVKGLSEDVENIAALSEMSSSALSSLLLDKDVHSELVKYFSEVIHDKSTLEASEKLLRELSQDPKVHDLLTSLLVRLVLSSKVQKASLELAESVIMDDHIQESTGDALWNTLLRAVRPVWLTPVQATVPEPA